MLLRLRLHSALFYHSATFSAVHRDVIFAATLLRNICNERRDGFLFPSPACTGNNSVQQIFLGWYTSL